MRIAGTIQDSIVDGLGFRFVVFAQGCKLHCEGCHNPQTWDENGGYEVSADDIIREMLQNPLTDGLTLSGGEPFYQAGECIKLASAAKNNSLSVWIYTGFTFEELLRLSENEPDISVLLRLADVLIDGAFLIAERSLSLKWRGSKNQRVLDMPKSLAANAAVELDV